MSTDEPCRHAGCPRPRSRHSVFCDEHHEERLARSGFPRAKPPHPCEVFAKRCRRVVNARERGPITDEEVCGQLADLFVYAGVIGEGACWSAGLDALPAALLEKLRAYVWATDRAYGFFATTPEKREAAREVRRELERCIDERLPDAGKHD